MSLRLILIIIGALIVAAILIDGYRHWRKAKKYQENLDNRTSASSGGVEPKISKKIDYIDDLDFTPKIRLDDSSEVRVKPNPNVNLNDEVRVKPNPLLNDEFRMKPKSTFRTGAHSNYTVKTTPTVMNIPEPLPKKDKFIILHVLAEEDTYFSGEGLQAKFSSQNLHFGPMGIFHQYENEEGTGQILFSVANAFEPGTLNLEDPEGFYTQGLTLFIQLPHRADADIAFESMLNLATLLAKAFNARLCDQHRQPLTASKVEEYRNEVSACNVI